MGGMRHSGRGGLVCAAVLATMLMVPAAAQAAVAISSAAPITVGNTGAASKPFSEAIEAASSAGILYYRSTPGGRARELFGLPAGESKPVALTGIPSAYYLMGLNGTLAVATNSDGELAWENLDGSGAGHGPIVPPSQASNYTWTDYNEVAAPGGWVTLATPVSDPSLTDVLLVNTSESGVTVLGQAPSGASLSRAGANGVLEYDSLGYQYIPFASPHAVVTLKTGFPASQVLCDQVLTTAAVCEYYDSSTSTQYGLRIPLSGAGATKLVVPSALQFFAATPNDVGWSTSTGVFYEPWTGGTVTSVSGPFSPFDALISDGTSRFVYTGGTTVGASGIAEVAPPASAGSYLVTAGAAPVADQQLAVGPGRVAWTDDKPASGVAAGDSPVWSRTLTNGGATALSAGPINLIETDASDYTFGGGAFSVSGQRILYNNGTGNLVLAESTAPGATAAVVAPVSSGAEPYGQVSGNRVLWEDTSTGSWSVYNLVSGKNAALTAIPTYSEVAIWGDYVVWNSPDSGSGQVWELDLAQPAKAPVELYAPPSGDSCFQEQDAPASVIVSDGYIAWAEQCTTSTLETVNINDYESLAPGSSPATLPGVPVAMSDEYVALQPVTTPSALPSPVLRAFNLVTRSDTFVGDESGAVGLNGSVLAWVNSAGTPVAEALPSEPDPPRYLGNGSVPARYTGGTWVGSWDASAPLTACQATISAGSTTETTVPCQAAAMAVGVAQVSWDGKDSSGTSVPAGTYTWKVTAANADGALETGVGAPLTLAGVVTVT